MPTYERVVDDKVVRCVAPNCGVLLRQNAQRPAALEPRDGPQEGDWVFYDACRVLEVLVRRPCLSPARLERQSFLPFVSFAL